MVKRLLKGNVCECFKSENCMKFSPANGHHHNWEPIHQSFMLRGTIDSIGQ